MDKSLSNWFKAGIIDDYKRGYASFGKTTERTSKYLDRGHITEAQAEEIAIACPVPEYEEAVDTEQAEADAEE